MRSPEKLLDGFEPNFKFTPIDPLPASEFEDRVRRIRREATLGGYDAILIHTDIIGWYHTSNSYLRYVCDWIREGLLVLPTDAGAEPTMLTIFSSSVLLPPPGEPVGVHEILQVGPWDRETWDRPGNTYQKVAEAAKDQLVKRGLGKGKIAVIGDAVSERAWGPLKAMLPGASFTA